MSLTLTNTNVGPGVVDNTKIDANFADVANKFGNIDNSDIKSGAGIDIAKLSANYEYMTVPLAIQTWPASTGVVTAVPIYNDSNGSWTVSAIQWVCSDTGTGVAAFKVQWAYYTTSATPALTATDLCSATTISNNSATANTQNQSTVAVTSSTLTFDANTRMLALNITTLGASMLDLAGQPNFFSVGVLLKRQIAT